MKIVRSKYIEALGDYARNTILSIQGSTKRPEIFSYMRIEEGDLSVEALWEQYKMSAGRIGKIGCELQLSDEKIDDNINPTARMYADCVRIFDAIYDRMAQMVYELLLNKKFLYFSQEELEYASSAEGMTDVWMDKKAMARKFPSMSIEEVRAICEMRGLHFHDTTKIINLEENGNKKVLNLWEDKVMYTRGEFSKVIYTCGEADFPETVMVDGVLINKCRIEGIETTRGFIHGIPVITNPENIYVE